jgi:hypothetical protein
MKRGSMKSTLRCVGIGLAVLCLTAGCLPKDKDREELEEALDRGSCEANLKMIALYLEWWAEDHGGELPETFSELYPDYIGEIGEEPMFEFVCPSTKHKSGNPERIDEWSDYVYNGGKRWKGEGAPPTLIAYEKPGNHAEGRYELYSDGTVKWKPL